MVSGGLGGHLGLALAAQAAKSAVCRVHAQFIAAAAHGDANLLCLPYHY